ncbi:MAG: translation elongation factor Ts [Paracoccus sp. (in: a-proteobacteria)]|uniref:translation elongation factor Ts n=1 Tax=Paracoccus sp. TaxID=267 RepID=UPI0026DECC90|nr:translation elongation factor Ts [Paracoccus sp. (in: a-proteobacteria)]MDO5621269.1 translation elongation factor Ts [Paracoccus sp. (in: a-proteobacteria)]
MSITAAMVKDLREKTGAGMMDAKKALTETAGDFEAAIDWLRTKGLAKAAKKSDRVAAEGLVGVSVRDGRGVAIELNSETDFVAKNADFQKLVREIADVAVESADSVEVLRQTHLNGKPVEEVLTDAIARIGENMTLRRLHVLDGDTIVHYVHNAAAEGMGKIGVLVALKGDKAQAETIGKQIAMHIAATNPASLSEADLDPALVEREKNVLTEQARESGKPDAVIEKMIVGRMAKFFEEVTLLGQKFVMNPDITVAQAAKEAGVEVTGFARVEVGEGIEKKEEDFAAEVAKTLSQA